MAAKIDIVRCRIDENHVLDACAEIEKKIK